MAIKAHSGGITSLPLPDIRLDDLIADGDILVYDATGKIFVNSIAADRETGKLFITGATSGVGGQSLLTNSVGNDLGFKSLASGNLIDIQPSVDGNSLVINVDASIASKLGGSDGFTGELKSSQIVLAGPGPTHEYGFLRIHNNDSIQLNANYTIVYRNGRRLNPSDYTFTENNTLIFSTVRESDILHVDTITNETDVKLVHSKPAMGVANQTSYQFLDQLNNLMPIANYFQEVFVNKGKVHQSNYIVQENTIVFASGFIIDQDQIELITLGDI